MFCKRCYNILIVKNNPNYKLPNKEHETHLIYICDNCDKEIKNNIHVNK